MHDLPGANIRDIVELVRRWNVTPEALLDGLPVTVEALAEPTTRVPIRVCEAIIARAHQLTNEPALALHLGAQMRVSTHGFLGFAAMTASTAREALELAVKFASTRTSAIGLALYIEGETASIVIEERTPLGAMREFAVLALAVGIWQIGRALTGKPLDGIVECAFAAPPYIDRWPHGGRLHFDRPAHRLVFEAGVLDLPLVTADLVARRLATEQLERELARIEEGMLASRIHAALARDPRTSLDTVAKQLAMSPRTVKRKLADQGTTFSVIRDEHRRQRALLLIENRGLSIGEIAQRLGYTELPSFTRVFRKWTGATPAAYRARLRDVPP
ncbi:MAG TPA: AraC family transcriptional regulator [Kofleriaceae bacterium]|nr:AraC family transcriptional regulator [Kofleriaceae bacterium]